MCHNACNTDNTGYRVKNTIKVERAKLSITQTDLAEVVNVSKQTIHSIETGRFVPSTIISMKIARYFGVSVDDIFTLEEDDLK
jgi:putative transcriptional regulator